MLARSGSYVVRSRVIDDDAHVWLDFEWGESSDFVMGSADAHARAGAKCAALDNELMRRLQARQGVVDRRSRDARLAPVRDTAPCALA